jgi:hypothetical protein
MVHPVSQIDPVPQVRWVREPSLSGVLCHRRPTLHGPETAQPCTPISREHLHREAWVSCDGSHRACGSNERSNMKLWIHIGCGRIAAYVPQHSDRDGIVRQHAVKVGHCSGVVGTRVGGER